VDYVDWRSRWVEVDDAARTRIGQLTSALPYRPKFTLLVSVDEADVSLVVATVTSVANQPYSDWLLCLTNREPLDPVIANAIADVADERVRFTGPEPELFGEWVTRLTPGDLVHEAALFAVAEMIVSWPNAAVVYTDHDHVGPDGRFMDPHMKPDWNPDLLSGMDYFGVLTAYRSDLWEVHATAETSAHDLALRATTDLGPGQVVHIPHVLVSVGISGDGSHLIPATVRVARRLPQPPPRVSVIIPTRDQGRMLERCLTTLREHTDYPDLELVIVDHETTEVKALQVIDDLSRRMNSRIIRFSGPFNFAAMANRAAEVATGEVLVLLNNDTEIVDPGWLTEMVAEVSRPEVGVVGAMLLFGNGTVQHAGVNPGVGGLMGHGHKHRSVNDPGYFGRLTVTHEVAAVTGACLAIEEATWRLLGGLDEKHLAVAYNDIDLCLQARQADLRVVFTPHARLIHHESVSRGIDEDPDRNQRLGREVEVMRGRWGDLLNSDPAYSPNLSLDGGGFRLADTPRVKPRWRE